ncbi:hypothetical protein BDD12DRAFT_889072 [Trichophaea hybrida]|nr:hypothetical protein BDD12DRAFT_889072 [Trichophaea hybrida]
MEDAINAFSPRSPIGEYDVNDNFIDDDETEDEQPTQRRRLQIRSPAPSLPTPLFLPLPFSLPATPTQPASSPPPPPPSPHGSQPSVAPHIGAPSPAPSYQQEGTPAPEIITDKRGKKRNRQSFQFHNERVFLTWSHLLEKPSVEQILFAMSTWRYKLRQWIACYERHRTDEDGNAGTFHIHLVGHITLNSKGNTVNIKNPRAFYLKIDREIYHAKIQPARSLADTWCYVKKTGPHEFHTKPVDGKKIAGDCDPAKNCQVEGQRKSDVHCNGDPQDHKDIIPVDNEWILITDPRLDQKTSDDSRDRWSTLANIDDRKTFIAAIRQLAPRELIVSHNNIRQYMDFQFGPEKPNNPTPYIHGYTSGFRSCEPIDKFFDRFVTNRPDDRQRCPSLCIVSSSGSGKTEYVRQFGLHTYHNECFGPQLLNTDALYNVFDDIPWEFWKQNGDIYKSWAGGQKQVNYSGKYLRNLTLERFLAR